MTPVIDFVQGRRKAYQRLPRWLRLILVAVAFAVGVAGVISMFTPLAVFEVGTILVSLSLGLLSFEFEWARRLLLYLTKKVADKTVRRRMLIGVAIIVAAYLSIFILVVLK